MSTDSNSNLRDFQINPSSTEAKSFVESSQPQIEEVLRDMYVKAHRDPMRILELLSNMLGRDIYIREDYNANSPYTTLGDGALSLHVSHGMSEPDRERYKAMINELIKPKLIDLAKELDRAAQDEILANTRNNLDRLSAARASLSGVEFPPIDPRLSGVREDKDAGEVDHIRRDSGDVVRALLMNVFNKSS